MQSRILKVIRNLDYFVSYILVADFYYKSISLSETTARPGVHSMEQTPWSRPTMDDLKQVLESFGNSEAVNVRDVDRLELSVPAEVKTLRGNTISAMTREISRQGLGLLHKGMINPGEVTVKLASETREFEYRVKIMWCTPCENGMFISGGEFITKPED
ncbi:hypothetical protein V202x_36240 [Gimesia aquarii]|uniref:PilZ domain-containing protein n=2 Tax=Gimesia aquarii TaxID=2527964 RepID=A0A517VUH7_9PLAN|nr:hypothetical protein V144x_21070 [Gimesia aquarii]QDU10225.1 hypothetical protein V202x_36240 [Gimesia aquarii]